MKVSTKTTSSRINDNRDPIQPLTEIYTQSINNRRVLIISMIHLNPGLLLVSTWLHHSRNHKSCSSINNNSLNVILHLLKRTSLLNFLLRIREIDHSHHKHLLKSNPAQYHKDRDLSFRNRYNPVLHSRIIRKQLPQVSTQLVLKAGLLQTCSLRTLFHHNNLKLQWTLHS